MQALFWPYCREQTMSKRIAPLISGYVADTQAETCKAIRHNSLL